MHSKKAAWAILSIIAGPAGVAVARMHDIGPNPGTFFALGVLASLTVCGIAYGFIEGSRVAREGRQIRN